MGNFVSYSRVSTAEQGRSGLGLEAQQAAITHYLRQDDQLLAGFVEVESGKRCDRPELQRALDYCQLHRATLLIAKLDRLGRNVAFVATLMERRVPFVAADMPHADAFRLHLEAAIAEDEMKKISVRTRAALAAAKARGVKLGGLRENAPDLRLYQPAGSAEAARKAADFAASVRPLVEELKAKGLSLRAIAAELDRRRIPAMRGGKWRASAVQNLLLRGAGAVKPPNPSSAAPPGC